MKDGTAGGLLNMSGGLFEIGSSTRTDGDVCALAGEFQRDSAAEALACCSDDGYASCESQVHSNAPPKTSIVSRNESCVNAAHSNKRGGDEERILFAREASQH